MNKYLLLKKFKSHLTNFDTYDLETHKSDRAKPYVLCFYRLNKVAGRYNCDLFPDELEKCKKDFIAFDGDNCVTNDFDFCLNFRVE